MVDMAIIGAGPAGLSAAINGVARGKTVRLFSGESNYLAKAERVDNYLGFYQMTGKQMMKQFFRHANQMGVSLEKGKVANVLALGDRFLLNFNGEIISSKTVILASGVSKAKKSLGSGNTWGRALVIAPPAMGCSTEANGRQYGDYPRNLPRRLIFCRRSV